MEGSVIIQGTDLKTFLKSVEESAYQGYKRAIAESKPTKNGIDWSVCGQLMTVKQVATLFNRQPDTIRRWIRDEYRFGDYIDTGRPMVTTESVKRVYESEFIKSKKR